jgi:hypothetical protein
MMLFKLNTYMEKEAKQMIFFFSGLSERLRVYVYTDVPKPYIVNVSDY